MPSDRKAPRQQKARLLDRPEEENSSTILKGVRSQLVCPGCKLLYEGPRVLACSHTFCRLCIEKAAKRARLTPQGGQISCPECGVKTDVPEGDTTQLQYNFFIQHIMDLMSYYSSPEVVPLVYCGMCRKDGVDKLPHAVARCSTCAMFMCKQCYELHSIDDLTKLHSTLSITERGDSGFFGSLFQDESGVKQCKKHSLMTYDYFCITCSKGICELCVRGEHKMHLYAKAEELRPEYTAYIQELMSRTNRLLRRTEHAIKATQDLTSGIQLLAATQIEEILRTQDVLSTALEGREALLLQEVDKYAATTGAASSSNGAGDNGQGGSQGQKKKGGTHH